MKRFSFQCRFHRSSIKESLSFVLVSSLFLNSCIPSLNQVRSGKTPPPNNIQSQIEAAFDLSKGIEDSEIADEIQEFRNRVKEALRASKALSPETWKLYDKLLDEYIKLKKRKYLLSEDQKLLVPQHSQVKIQFSSFCLNGSRACPQDTEVYRWDRGNPKIQYYREVLQYAYTHPNVPHGQVQNLLWNLQFKTNYEDYPDDLKRILLEIDPKAPLKLPSELKSKAFNYLKDFVMEHVPGSEKAQEASDLIQGRYYDYKDFADQVLKMKSKYALKPAEYSQPIEGTDLFADTQSHGFSEQDVTFYNPTDHDVHLKLGDYYLNPERSDVQRIALLFPRWSTKNEETASALETALYADLARLGIGVVPGLNMIADGYELLTGKGFVDGRPLSTADRVLAGIGLIAGAGADLRYAKSLIYAPEAYKGFIEDGFRVASKGRELQIAGDAGVKLDLAERTVANIEKSPTLSRIYENPSFRQADFYVRPNGEVIPARGYRYIPDNAKNLPQIIKTGEIPPGPDKITYVSFSKYDKAPEAADKLQLPAYNNAKIRVEFNTGPIADEMEIPNAEWGKGNYLEPIANSMPHRGSGGGFQAITSKPITAKRIVNLETGEILYERR